MVRHEAGIGPDTEDPAVQAQQKVEQPLRVSAAEQEGDACHNDKEPDQAAADFEDILAIAEIRRPPDQAADEEADDQIVRDRQQPPFDEDKAPRKLAGISNIEACGVVNLGV